MKIRIKGNTVRYRLSKSEVALLAKNGLLEEKTEFMNGTLVYAVKESERQDVSAELVNNSITIYVPHAALQTWTYTDQIGIDYHISLPNGNTLYLLLEKDFKCMDMGEKEDQSDYFENPHLTC